MEVSELKPIILDLFQSFLNGGITKQKLINELYKLEIDLTDLDNIGDKGLWFRFFKGDLVNTIRDVDRDIDCPTNKEHILDCIKTAIEEPKHFKVIFS